MSADVVLVSLPFGVLHSPSLGLALLQARLNAAGIRTKCRHFTLDYAAEVGADVYSKIASGFPRTTDLLGEWMFSHALAPRTSAADERYLARTFETESDGRAQLIADVRQLARSSGEFADFAAREVLQHRPRIVGLTTVFQQNLGTLAVASRIRQLDPAVKIVLGGANCESVMGQELARAYPFIDLVVSGEADAVIVPLVECLLAGEDPCTSGRLRPLVDISAAPRFIQAHMVPDLDRYVSPTFDDYFDDLHRLRDRLGITVELPLETSRGCWWGMKHHCTFCGLNGSTMAFRSRPADDAFEEIVATATKHPGSKLCFVDNILDYRYYDRLLPKLAELGPELDLFYEIKSNVTRPQVQALKDAGVGHIQPGIESLSDQVLTIMKKGVHAIQNIQLLKWCAEYGIAADWNVLCGFPGEDPGEYPRMARLVPLLCHFQPPARCSEIRVDRFSPNFTRATELGFSNVRPYDAYNDVYAGTPAAVENLAYFFAADGVARDALAGYTRSLVNAIDLWRAAYGTSSLAYLELGDRVVVVDSRAMLGNPRTVVLEGFTALVFLLCDAAQARSSLLAALPGASPSDVDSALAFLCDQHLVWCDGTRYLSLPVSFTRFLESRGTKNVQAAIDDLLARPARIT